MPQALLISTGGEAARWHADEQEAGNTKMREFGSVEIPQEAFIAALKMDEN